MGDVSTGRPRLASGRSARSGLMLVLFLGLSYAAAAIGSMGMVVGDWMPWYDALEKPDWTPSGLVIGAVWTVLYALMGVAAWLVWRRTGWRGGEIPLGLFLAQLALNALWSVLFFGAHWLGVAFVEIVVLWVAVLATTLAFARVRRDAAWLMAPYLAWVAFAGFLNATIWRLNA